MLRINRRDAMVGHQSHLQNRQQIHAENSPVRTLNIILKSLKRCGL